MHDTAVFLIATGSIMLLGIITDVLGRHTYLPRVTLLLIFGMLIGPYLFDLLPSIIITNFNTVADVALLMIGFLVGGRLTRNLLEKIGRNLLSLSLGAVFATAVVVSFLLWCAGVPPEISIVLGCIATATDPAATMDVIDETGSRGPFVDLLTSIVALDDAWGLIIFSLGIAVAGFVVGGNGIVEPMVNASREIFGAVLIGLLVGVPASFLTGRLRPGKPVLFEALGVVFLCGGLAIYFEVSFLIAAIVMGATIANLARHHEYPFHAIENIESPFLILFFVLAGASLEFDTLKNIGVIGAVYVGARIAGKVTGVWTGGLFCNVDKTTRNWMGLALLPQAGVAMGMALVASNYFPVYQQLLLSVAISTTVVFELTGPLFTRLALRKSATGNQ